MKDEPAVKTAFVLPGGGSFGSIQVGMLKALVESGIRTDLIVGCSVGALNSAYFASAPDRDGVARLEAIWRSLRRKDVFPTSLSMLWQAFRHREAHVSTHGLRKLIDTHLPYSQIEDAAVPLHILAADFMTGEPVVLSHGPVTDAILASSAVPAAFAPIKHGTRYLTDGAMAAVTPLRIAADLGAKRIILLPVSVACAMSVPPRGAFAHVSQAITLMMARQVLADCRELATKVEISVLPPLCPLDGSPHSFDQTGELIDRAYRSTSAWIEAGHHESCELPPAMFMHRH
jgi:NTE family protein